eukprot:CAMPEP_0118676118 /NCGR_PEP_ID=MMETSP0800-20121206/1857_1 /TAXON_ID=210618 ORGANISM="Striatella unipunctata, Strain CCMP2910" /NCGR_SAMPLE_ID=MMETSP0800 /ASSEMBLY_ACC=CAM_ASM_000638 /LENGTH=305 /DNA_ID=CAMNT_0006571571 /DNA_START=37 /DNA_END=954 /DNA_ORIENTATION=-
MRQVTAIIRRTKTTNASTEELTQRLAQQRAYEFYRLKRKNDWRLPSVSSFAGNTYDRNVRMASYAMAAVIGAVGATYASVPLYKMFCQATGFGGTTQRVSLPQWAKQQEDRENAGSSSRPARVSQQLWDKLVSMSNVPSSMLPTSGNRASHVWTDEEAAEKLASLKPLKNAELITVRFDSTVGDVLPWSFTPTQLDVKVVPGETALSFFTVTNHSDKPITGVATYNVYPPKAGLYFNKIQCFCFEEQRLLPGETVDMPVFFFVDPAYADDPQISKVTSLTLAYTFFQTDVEYDDEDDDDEEEEAA